MSHNKAFQGTPTSIFRHDADRKKLTNCQGSPLKTAVDCRNHPDSQSTMYVEDMCSPNASHVLFNYDQIVGCILESLKAGSVSLDDFERGIDAVRGHLSVSRRTFNAEVYRTLDLATPRAGFVGTPVQQRQRSCSMNIRPGPLHFEDEETIVKGERKWSIDTASTSLPQSCTNERRLKFTASIPCGSPHIGCSPAPNIPLPPASPSTFSLTRPRIFSHSMNEPTTPSPGSSPLITPSVTSVDISAASPIKVSDVSLGDVVGSGSFGVVYRARVNATGQLIVVKMVNIDIDLSDDLLQVDALLNELQLLQSLHHDRIVRYLGHERIVGKSLYQLGPIPGPDSSDKLLIFCEYMPGGSLASTIKQFGALDEKAIALHTKHILEVSRILNEIR